MTLTIGFIICFLVKAVLIHMNRIIPLLLYSCPSKISNRVIGCVSVYMVYGRFVIRIRDKCFSNKAVHTIIFIVDHHIHISTSSMRPISPMTMCSIPSWYMD